jgi:hypothetical protein
MKKGMIPVVIAIFAAFLAVAGALAQYKEKEDAKKKAEESKAEAREFNKKLVQSQVDLIDEQKRAKKQSEKSSHEIIRLNQELVKKTTGLLNESENVKNTQQETIKFILGTETPEVKVLRRNDGEFAIVFDNSTEYPIYDIILKVQDFDEIIKCKTIIKDGIVYIGDECVSKASVENPPFFMAPGSVRKQPFQFSKPEEVKHIRIECLTRRKLTIFCCVIKNVNGKIFSNIRVYDYGKNKNIFVKELHYGLKIPNEDYWENHFFVSKTMFLGPEPTEEVVKNATLFK